jgi:hypothetical protein
MIATSPPRKMRCSHHVMGVTGALMGWIALDQQPKGIAKALHYDESSEAIGAG